MDNTAGDNGDEQCKGVWTPAQRSGHDMFISGPKDIGLCIFKRKDLVYIMIHPPVAPGRAPGVTCAVLSRAKRIVRVLGFT